MPCTQCYHIWKLFLSNGFAINLRIHPHWSAHDLDRKKPEFVAESNPNSLYPSSQRNTPYIGKTSQNKLSTYSTLSLFWIKIRKTYLGIITMSFKIIKLIFNVSCFSHWYKMSMKEHLKVWLICSESTFSLLSRAGKSVRLLWTMYLTTAVTGSRERWRLVHHSFSHFQSIQDSTSFYGITHILHVFPPLLQISEDNFIDEHWCVTPRWL